MPPRCDRIRGLNVPRFFLHVQLAGFTWLFGGFTWLRPRVSFPLNPLFTTFLHSSAQSLGFYSYLCRRYGFIYGKSTISGEIETQDTG